jgi:hypothetical protein
MSNEFIYAEHGKDFQEYIYADTGKRVPAGEAVGYEIDGELVLLEGIQFSSEHDDRFDDEELS